MLEPANVHPIEKSDMITGGRLQIYMNKLKNDVSRKRLKRNQTT